ncbi:MAG: TolC family protein [Bacteroidales bacterium]
MRTLILLCCLFLISGLSGQKLLKLDEAVRRSIAHKPSLQVLRLQSNQQQLSVREAKANWWPEISFAYDYRYNPVVATTVIPIGQFDINNPTNVVRGIKMGTKWQQNTGITLSQTLIDWSVIRNIKRSKLAAKRAVSEEKSGRDELIFEAARSYLNICRYEQQTLITLNDTLRTFTTLAQQEVLFANERLLISDLNRARINHNDAISRWQNSVTDLIAEKLYLAFLTGIPNDSMLLSVRFDQESLSYLNACMRYEATPDSLHSLQTLQMDEQIARQDLRVAKARSLPTLSLNAFFGGNQFNDCLSPFEKGTWYASSYIGISIQWPILYRENFTARNKRLRLEAQIQALRKTEESARYQTDALIAAQRFESLRQEIERLEKNKILEEEVLRVLGKRFEEQRASAFELNLEALEYLKLQGELQEKQTEQILQSLEYLKNTGLLYLLQSPAQP